MSHLKAKDSSKESLEDRGKGLYNDEFVRTMKESAEKNGAERNQNKSVTKKRRSEPSSKVS